MKFNYSNNLLDYLKNNKINIYACAYKSNSIVNICTIEEKNTNNTKLSLWKTSLDRPMSIQSYKDKLIVGCRRDVLQFSKDGESKTDNEQFKNFDVTFNHQLTNITNGLDIHDIVFNDNGKPYFCSSMFSCVGELSDKGSFKVYWKPPWISKIAPEGRCHLNGLCCVDGVPTYITSISRCDVLEGWRHNRNKGVVYDITTNTLICKNLSMPHSPVWYNNKLWVLESGTGYFGYIDMDREVSENDETYHPFVKTLFLPGFLRGISFINSEYVIIGSSKDRHDNAFSGLELSKTLKNKEAMAKCGIYIIKLESMEIEHFIMFDDPFIEDGPSDSLYNSNDEINEIYDVLCIHDCNRSVLKTCTEIDQSYYKIL